MRTETVGEGTVMSEVQGLLSGSECLCQAEICREEVSYIAFPCLLWKPAGGGYRGQPSRTSHFSKMHGVVLVGLAEGPSSLHAFSLSLVEKLSLKDLIFLLARPVFFLPTDTSFVTHVPETSYFGFRTQDESLMLGFG